MKKSINEIKLTEEENKKDFEKEFNEKKSRYDKKEIVKGYFCKYKMQLVFNELSEIKEFYLLLNPSLKSKPIYDNTVYPNFLSERRVVYEKDKYFLIKPSFIKKYNHYKTFKYVLNRISKINYQLLDNSVLYDNPTLPIIDKPEPINLDKIKNIRPNRFPCNFEKVYNELDFSKYLIVHYHKIKNRHNLTQINKLNKLIF